MIFIPETVYEARAGLWRDYEAGALSQEQLFQRALALDPDDPVALVGLGKLRREAGDLAAAEEYFWRAARAHPAEGFAYGALAEIFNERPEAGSLGIAMNELALRKYVPGDDEPIPEPDYEAAGFSPELGREFRSLPQETRLDLMIGAMQECRENEPARVTELMRPLRLIQDLLEDGIVDSDDVDEMIGEGDAIVPLLVGVLRDWAQDALDDDDVSVESALALLGEIGSAENIPDLLEFTELEHDGAAGCSAWALERILKRDPERAARKIEELAPGLGLADRLTLTNQITRYPALDTGGKLLQKFSEGADGWDPAERDSAFPVLLGAMAMTGGRTGLGRARGVLQRHGGTLSRAARRDCETLLATIKEADLPSIGPSPSPWTIYEICAGEVDWEDVRQLEEDEIEEDFSPEPEPIRRAGNRGRNDPCWCNSGKKYKKCHLESDEKARQEGAGIHSVSRENRAQRTRPVRSAEPSGNVDSGNIGSKDEFNSLRQQLGRFLFESTPDREMKRAAEAFTRDDDNGEESQLLLIDWLIHDWVVPKFGLTVLRQFLAQRGPRLTSREREAAEAWSRRHVGLYEVQESMPGTGVTVKDLLAGETLFVHDIAASERLALWDGLFARVVPGERGSEFSSAVETVPRRHIAPLLDWMEQDRTNAHQSWPVYMKHNWPRVRRKSFEVAQDSMDSLRLANTDGEELLFSKAIYSVTNADALLAALRNCSDFEEDESSEHSENFVWLNKEKTILGRITLEEGQLALECNSKARLERGHALLMGQAEDSINHLRDEFTTQKEMRRRVKDGSHPVNPAPEPLPPEIAKELIAGYMEDHYRKWPDMKLPALGGLTPREAANTPGGRRKLETLLKDFENGEDRKRRAGGYAYDFARLRAELGM